MFAHIVKKLEERELKYSELFLMAVAKNDCSCADTAVILQKLDNPVPYIDDSRSNGDLVILIVRENRPVTIMFRRSNQDADIKSMRKSLDVQEVLWLK